MSMEQKRNTVPYRAWKDTTFWLRNAFTPRILVAIIPLLCGIFFGIIGALVGLILFPFLTYLIHLVIVPYRQITEADKKDIAEKKILKEAIQEYEADKNFSRTELKDTTKVFRLTVPNPEQSNAIRRINKPIGITETSSGKPALIYPIDNAWTLGNISMGSPQTFTGLNIDDESPIFISIPRIGYVLIMIAFISNDKVEVKFMADTKTELPYRTATVTLVIESQAVSLFIPAGPNRFFSQVSEVTIDKWQGAASIQIVTGM